MLQYERGLWPQYENIAGIDEAGRGCLLGDVVAAAVILPKGMVITEINDSKKLSEKKRAELYDIIMDQAIAVGIGRVDSQTIDRINIKQAARLAMKLAVDQLAVKPDYLLVDAEQIDSDLPQLSVIKGDAVSQSIAAASIIAKVTRDRLCQHWDMQYPAYGIAGHKGYATKKHREMIVQYGPSELHRITFLRNILGQEDKPSST